MDQSGPSSWHAWQVFSGFPTVEVRQVQVPENLAYSRSTALAMKGSALALQSNVVEQASKFSGETCLGIISLERLAFFVAETHGELAGLRDSRHACLTGQCFGSLQSLTFRPLHASILTATVPGTCSRAPCSNHSLPGCCKQRLSEGTASLGPRILDVIALLPSLSPSSTARLVRAWIFDAALSSR